MRRHWQYLKYVLRHKIFVLLAGRQLGVPLWILLLHDWDKFLPDEWLPYARCFYKPDGTKQYDETPEFARAWMLHQHRNKHHWQYWLKVYNKVPIYVSNCLVWDRGNAQQVVERNFGGVNWIELRDMTDDLISVGAPMPDVYRREMLADWRGAGRALGFPDTLDWYTKNRDKMRLHPETRAWLDKQLGYIGDKEFKQWLHNNVSGSVSPRHG